MRSSTSGTGRILLLLLLLQQHKHHKQQFAMPPTLLSLPMPLPMPRGCWLLPAGPLSLLADLLAPGIITHLCSTQCALGESPRL